MVGRPCRSTAETLCLPWLLPATVLCVVAGTKSPRCTHMPALRRCLQAQRGEEGLPEDARAKLDATVEALDK